jgi:Arc/MetJ family transcription regulator
MPVRAVARLRVRVFCQGYDTKAEVYRKCMARTNIDIDEDLCRRVMARFNLATKREAVNLALRHLAAEPMSLDEARSLRGTGWEGDLDEMRASRS